MKSLRFLVLLFSFTLISHSIFSQAESLGAPEGIVKIAKHNVKKWKQKLMLSVNQTKYMEERMTAFEMKRSEIFNADYDMNKKNAALTTLSKELHGNMGDILTPKQYETYKAEIKDISGQ